ncbi:Fic family protein [Mucilaginibacter sp. X5P1]|uniref:Fic family protein n=1 Tax=Mucilaginibacter sp. X5P1 TaxID=2723088 RepID=UPI001607D23A|nr:Fic family protein [Mucilaginibacter sp. X5P1]MBB6141831.1 Fic family protein [Mucilaginibacter sp. X5P1]
MYIHQLKDWPFFIWNTESIHFRLGEVRHRQGRILGLMSSAGFKLQESAVLNTLTLDVTKSSEIEGEKLNTDQVRSSIARRLGIEIAGAMHADRNVDGVVEMMLDATQKYTDDLTADRLFDWHAALFPTGRSGMHKIKVAAWRTPQAGPMQVVSGAMGKEKVHFEAPEAGRLPVEMDSFLNWFNAKSTTDAVLKAAIAHLWFVTIHPFDDGNGRITRAITDMQLARADKTPQRFYSMSAQILKERAAYYAMLEQTQKGSLDITPWLSWFLDCLFHAMDFTEETLSTVATRTQFWEKNRGILLNSRQQYMVSALLDEFHGKLTSTKWAKMTKSSPDTALRDIQDLIEKGILEKEPGGGRNTTYALITI